MLAAIEAGCTLVEYTPAEVKRAVVGYGRAEKRQVQQMVKLLLGLSEAPSPHDAADALAVAICHVHSGVGRLARLKPSAAKDPHSAAKDPRGAAKDPQGAAKDPRGAAKDPHRAAQRFPARLGRSTLRSWRNYRPPAGG